MCIRDRPPCLDFIYIRKPSCITRRMLQVLNQMKSRNPGLRILLEIPTYPYEMCIRDSHRGSFTEFLKTPDRGQLSINISKPGITKGNHWHHSKVEKFLVVSGEGVVRFRKIGSSDFFEVPVSDRHLQVVDIPPGYTHHIENTGDQDMVTIIWVNEPFDPAHADTYYLEV